MAPDTDPLEFPDEDADVPVAPSPTRCVLVAEDDDELRTLILGALEGRGFGVVGVRDGQELLQQLSSGVLAPDKLPLPAALVTDLRMPGFSGLEVLFVLRQSGSRLPVVAITAFGDPETHARAFAAGATVVLDKPFAMRDLVANVTYLLTLPQ